jgi:hypothetical protein
MSLEIDEKMKSFRRDYCLVDHCKELQRSLRVDSVDHCKELQRSILGDSSELTSCRGGSGKSSRRNSSTTFEDLSTSDLRAIPSLLDEDFGDCGDEHSDEASVLESLPRSTLQLQKPGYSSQLGSLPTESTNYLQNPGYASLLGSEPTNYIVPHSEIDLDLDTMVEVIQNVETVNISSKCIFSDTQKTHLDSSWVLSQKVLGDDMHGFTDLTEV